jgi:CRP-like cAMP-binding protein
VSGPVFKTGSGRGGAPGHHVVDFAAGEYIFREGDLGTEMFIVHAGKVEILKQIEGEEKQLAVLERGDFFGEMSLLEELPRAAAARAESDVRLLQINGSTFDQMLRANPEIAVRMMRKLSRRLRQTDEMLERTMAGPHEAAAAVAGIPMRDAPADVFGPEFLVHEKSGMEFHLASGDESTLGRRDPVTGIYPEVDLTPVDSQRSVSRRHAKIFRRAGKLYVSEDIGTMNGTFVNGDRLETGVPSEVNDGDEVRVGLVDLRLRFADDDT